MTVPASPPVLLIHGIWDTASRLEPLRRGLVARGVGRVECVDLVPNDGRAPIAELGGRVAARVDEALGDRDAKVDLVGFSMGALVARWYVQRGQRGGERVGNKARVRRFVSISGPHRGTLAAYGVPEFAGFHGVRDMRPGSELLRDLAADRDPFGDVEVHCLYTPFDLMILPPDSGVLAGARSVRSFRVPMHRFMIRDAAVLDHVAGLLRAGA